MKDAVSNLEGEANGRSPRLCLHGFSSATTCATTMGTCRAGNLSMDEGEDELWENDSAVEGDSDEESSMICSSQESSEGLESSSFSQSCEIDNNDDVLKHQSNSFSPSCKNDHDDVLGCQAEARRPTANAFDGGILALTPTLIVLDFDDTLFPSSWVERNAHILHGSSRHRTLLWKQLQAHTISVIHFLHTARLLGNVVLVTLADRAWVRTKTQTYMPAAMNLLESVQVFCARDEATRGPHKSIDSRETKCWQKQLAMMRAIPTVMGDKAFHSFISIGDSTVEQMAARSVANMFYIDDSLSSAGAEFVKTVKLARRPNVGLLTCQLCFLMQKLPQLLRESSDRHVDLPQIATDLGN